VGGVRGVVFLPLPLKLLALVVDSFLVVEGSAVRADSLVQALWVAGMPDVPAAFHDRNSPPALSPYKRSLVLIYRIRFPAGQLSGPEVHMAASLLVDLRGNAVSLPDSPAPTPAASPATDERKRIIARLGEPFPFRDICWRVVERTKDKKRGLVTPYVKVGVLIDRLNSVLGEGCWSRTYQHRTIDNIPVTENNKTVIKGKVALICDIDVPGVGRNSGTGEAWSDDPNAFTSADTQAFKRAAECFGIGLYLRLVEKFWWDIDTYGRPLSMEKFAPSAAEKLTAALRRTGTVRPVEQALPTTSGNHNGSPATGNASRSQIPAQTTASRFAGQPSLRDELQTKKASYIASLGESLYTDATAKARSAIALGTAPVDTVNQIMHALNDACALLTSTRLLAAEVSPQIVDQILDTYSVQTFATVPSLEALNNVRLALETARDIQP